MTNTILKKRIIFLIFLICFSFSLYGIINIINKNNKSVYVNATPITNKTIILDAGHGLPDEGAVGFNSTTEQVLNLEITLKIQKLIEQSGANVILTRSDENGIYSTDSKSIRNKKISDTKNRVEIGNNSNADIFVSIHMNKYPPSQAYRGWQTFYQSTNENSKNLATLIQDNLNKNIDYDNSNRKPSAIANVYIIEHVKIPTVIVECGFLSNPEEVGLLKTDEYQNKLAWGIYIGIQNYFNSTQ